MAKEWLRSYESLCDMIVPGTSALIYSDEESNLYSVTIFKKKLEEFTINASVRKYASLLLPT